MEIQVKKVSNKQSMSKRITAAPTQDQDMFWLKLMPQSHKRGPPRYDCYLCCLRGSIVQVSLSCIECKRGFYPNYFAFFHHASRFNDGFVNGQTELNGKIINFLQGTKDGESPAQKSAKKRKAIIVARIFAGLSFDRLKNRDHRQR